MGSKALRLSMGACLVLSLMGVLAYLRLSFDGADRSTAIRLVHDAKIGQESLSAKIGSVIPSEDKVCVSEALRAFYGHMSVRCYDARTPKHELTWQVSLADGMVIPTNDPARRLGQGEVPW